MKGIGIGMKENKKKFELSAGETATFCGQVALILKAGIPLHDGMSTLTDSVTDTSAKQQFADIAAKVTETGSLHAAVSEAGFFPDYMVNMIGIGEKTGKLDDVLSSLEKYYQREDNTKRSIASAVTYPFLLVIMMSVVILLLVTRVLPIFEEVYSNLGTNMSSTGKFFMNVGRGVGYAALVVTLVFLVVAIFLFVLYKIKGSAAINAVIYKLPALRRVNEKITAGRFASVMAMMLGSGYSIEEALDLAPGIVNNSESKKKIEEIGRLVKKGKNFPEALIETNLFDALQTRMVAVGYKAGQLDSVMENMSDVYEREVDEAIDKLVSVIEPVLVAVLSVIIGGILVSVMLPLASIMSSL